MIKVHKDFLSDKERMSLLLAAQQVRMTQSPGFLGNFQFRYWKWPAPLPKDFNEVAKRLADLVPDQELNTFFLQRYPTGSYVKKHRDPKNNVSHTVIALFGNYRGAVNEFDGKSYYTEPGDVIVAPCTINGIQGPWHSVSEVESGVRWALIGNTII
jgi:hypothetical protein